jgi:CRP/FNR family transcriptional regulator
MGYERREATGDSTSLHLPLYKTEPALRPNGCAQCEIRHLTICSAFESNQVGHIEQLMNRRELSEGQSLFEEEGDAQYAYNLIEGTIRLYKLLPDGRRQITGFALPGDFLGLSSHGHYAYSAEAVSGAVLCRFKGSDLQRLFRNFPAIEHRVLSMANDELIAAQDQMLLLGRKTPMEKVSSFLLTLSARLVRNTRNHDELTLPMTRNDIADFLGLTVETVSRTFSKLRSAGIIALPTPDHVRISDRPRLMAVASGGPAI